MSGGVECARRQARLELHNVAERGRLGGREVKVSVKRNGIIYDTRLRSCVLAVGLNGYDREKTRYIRNNAYLVIKMSFGVL